MEEMSGERLEQSDLLEDIQWSLYDGLTASD